MHEEKEAGTAALTFEEFRKRITDDYFTAFLSCRLAFLKNHRSLIRNNDVRLLDFGRELVHLTLEKVIKDNDFIADDSKGAGYVVGLAGTTKLAENDVIKDFKGLKISGGEIVHWIISRKSLPPGHVIDAFNAAA
ncbi:MAG: hypothetical protein KJ607_12000, partial [Bacteroidetes bacterium]|nr:hypothetical protein [Bacteroidota bacterium]